MLTFKEQPLVYSPEMRDYAALWDSVYRERENADLFDWYRHDHRFPGVLAPESRVWWWRGPGRWFWNVRIGLYWRLKKRLVDGEKRYPTWVYRLLEPLFFEYERWYAVEWNHCPHCGCKAAHRDGYIDVNDSDWFNFRGGGSRFTGDYTQHWFWGEWTCWRCLLQWEYEDSD